MIGKGFVLFNINSSPTAFYIIKPTCISRLVFKVSKCLKKLLKTAYPKVCLRCRVMTSSLGGIQTSSLFVPRAPLNLIKYKKLISLQHRVRVTKSHIQNSTNHFFWDNVIERSHCTYNPLDVTPFIFCTASISRK